jgi:hypothetical protein
MPLAIEANQRPIRVGLKENGTLITFQILKIYLRFGYEKVSETVVVKI